MSRVRGPFAYFVVTFNAVTVRRRAVDGLLVGTADLLACGNRAEVGRAGDLGRRGHRERPGRPCRGRRACWNRRQPRRPCPRSAASWPWLRSWPLPQPSCSPRRELPWVREPGLTSKQPRVRGVVSAAGAADALAASLVPVFAPMRRGQQVLGGLVIIDAGVLADLGRGQGRGVARTVDDLGRRGDMEDACGLALERHGLRRRVDGLDLPWPGMPLALAVVVVWADTGDRLAMTSASSAATNGETTDVFMMMIMVWIELTAGKYSGMCPVT